MIEPVTTLVVSAIVGFLASLGSDLLNRVIKRKRNHDIELTFPDGTRKIIHVVAGATANEIDEQVRSALDASEFENSAPSPTVDPKE